MNSYYKPLKPRLIRRVMVVLDSKCELVHHWPRTVGSRMPVEQPPFCYVLLLPLCHYSFIKYSLFPPETLLLLGRMSLAKKQMPCG
jgi:hypothetical protein